MQAHVMADSNVQRHLRHNPYPGRGIVVGLSSGGDTLFMIYWIMGRSPASQNRRLVVRGTSLLTEPVGSAARAA